MFLLDFGLFSKISFLSLLFGDSTSDPLRCVVSSWGQHFVLFPLLAIDLLLQEIERHVSFQIEDSVVYVVVGRVEEDYDMRVQKGMMKMNRISNLHFRISSIKLRNTIISDKSKVVK